MPTFLILLIEVAVLASAVYAARWAYMRHQSGPRQLSQEEYHDLALIQRDGIRREVARRAQEAREYQERQRNAYARQWMATHPSGGSGAPKDFDPAAAEHVALAIEVVGTYDATLENPGKFADCLYRPAADLPYPREAIRHCCEFLIRIADGAVASPHLEQKAIQGERDALGFALFSLDYFLDVPAMEIPKQKMQNLAYVKQQQYRSAGERPLKPKAGDLIVAKDAHDNDAINQIIGLAQDNQWMVYGTSGSPRQIAYNMELRQWEEVQSVAAAPAPAEWLDLTPPAGMPAWRLTPPSGVQPA